jgi:Plastocyanin
MLFIFNLAKRLQRILLALVVGVAAVAFLSNPAAAETYTVKMGSDKAQLIYDPPTLTINQGDTVRWVNNKVYPHNVVFDRYLVAMRPWQPSCPTRPAHCSQPSGGIRLCRCPSG